MEVAEFIENKLPEIKSHLRKKTVNDSLKTTLLAFSDFTNKMMKDHNFRMITRCLNVAQVIHKNGIDTVKKGITDFYLNAILSFINSCSKEEQQSLHLNINSGLSAFLAIK